MGKQDSNSNSPQLTTGETITAGGGNEELVSVKISVREEIRRISLPNASYSALVESASPLFGIQKNGIDVIKYEDDDGDKISMSSDMEFREALRVAKSMQKVLRLYIEVKPEKQKEKEKEKDKNKEKDKERESGRYGLPPSPQVNHYHHPPPPPPHHHHPHHPYHPPPPHHHPLSLSHSHSSIPLPPSLTVSHSHSLSPRYSHSPSLHPPSSFHPPSPSLPPSFHPSPSSLSLSPSLSSAARSPSPGSSYAPLPDFPPPAYSQISQNDNINNSNNNSQQNQRVGFGSPSFGYLGPQSTLGSGKAPGNDWNSRSYHHERKHNRREYKESMRHMREQWKEMKRSATTDDDRKRLKELKGELKDEMRQVKREAMQNMKDLKLNDKKPRFVARHVEDVTIPDGTELPPNTPFIKTWKLRNEGPTWPSGSQLLFVSNKGDSLNGPERVVIKGEVRTGQEVEVSVPLITPRETGRYVGYYRMVTPDNIKFGQRVWVSFLVKSVTNTDEI